MASLTDKKAARAHTHEGVGGLYTNVDRDKNRCIAGVYLSKYAGLYTRMHIAYSCNAIFLL
jgi:hypothetical protein